MLLGAIRAHCLMRMGWDSTEVSPCTPFAFPLHPYGSIVPILPLTPSGQRFRPVANDETPEQKTSSQTVIQWVK